MARAPGPRRRSSSGTIDEELRADWDITVGWFDVLTSLQRLGGTGPTARHRRRPPPARRRASAAASTGLEEEGWVARHRHVDQSDKRAVDVELTKSGRRLWREMNVSYRRAVQSLFATHLDDDHIDDLRRILNLLMAAGNEVEELSTWP